MLTFNENLKQWLSKQLMIPCNIISISNTRKSFSIEYCHFSIQFLSELKKYLNCENIFIANDHRGLHFDWS